MGDVTPGGRRDAASRPGIVSDPTSDHYGSPCPGHQRDQFNPDALLEVWREDARARHERRSTCQLTERRL